MKDIVNVKIEENRSLTLTSYLGTYVGEPINMTTKNKFQQELMAMIDFGTYHGLISSEECPEALRRRFEELS